MADEDIQSTAPSNLLMALGLPEGYCFRGRGVIWAPWVGRYRMVGSGRRYLTTLSFCLKLPCHVHLLLTSWKWTIEVEAK